MTNRLPLSLFEEYLLHDDRPAHPCWILIRFRFRGGFDHKVLSEAVDHATGRHPMLSSVVRRRWTGRWFWERVPGWRTPVTWTTGLPAHGWPVFYPMDLTREPGFRLVVAEAAGGAGMTDLVFQSHHALFDAAGAAEILQEIMICYAQISGREVALPEVREETLPARAAFNLTWRDAPGQLLGLLVCLQLQLRKAAPVIPHRPAPDAGARPENLPSVVSRRFSAVEFRGMRDAAKRLGTGVNELLIRDFQAALGLWREAQGVNHPCEWIRLAVPVNLRRSADRFLPAVNMVSAVSLDRRADRLGDRKRLLRRAREDMDMVKKHKLGQTFLAMLWLCRLWPGGIRCYTRRSSPQSSAMLSNLGQLFPRSPLHNKQRRLEVPGAVLEDVVMIGPCRPGTCVVLEIALYAGMLMADMHYDSRVLTASQAEGLMREFGEQLRMSAESTE